jgi:transposase
MYSQTRAGLGWRENFHRCLHASAIRTARTGTMRARKIRGHLKRISGVDISLVDGMGVSLAQTVILECGTDMSKFPTEKHFGSWLGLAPKHEISGGKVLQQQDA